jgi:hypothetical protein
MNLNARSIGRRRIAGSLPVLLVACAFLSALSLRAESKPILAHYMPWYVAKPYSGSWGWHWTMNHYNPDTTNASGLRNIASWHYPLIGPYDSADPVVLEYHVLLMKLGGVDGVIADWYGQENYLDYGLINQPTLALLDYTRRAGLKFVLCYEDRTVQAKIDGGYITAANATNNAQQTMLYAQANYFNSPNYLQFSNKPVLLNFGAVYFQNNSQWVTIFSVLAASNQPAFFSEDIRFAVAMGAYNWPPMHLANGGTLTSNALHTYLVNFENSAVSWPAFISSAFPRFRDIYQQAGLGFTYGTLEDNNGQTFRSLLSRAMTNNSDMIQLVTWNDFGEGTIVEPTVEFGYRDLGVVQDFRRQYFDPDFPNTTNDLALPLRLYNLRRQFVGNAIINAELNRTFTNIVSGRLATANLQLTGLELKQPVIYDLALNDNNLRFSVGGFVSSNGADIQTTSNLAAAWQTAGALTVGTNAMTFSTPISPEGPPTFFKVRTSQP